MFNVIYNISGLNELKEKIDYINKMLQMTKDSKFQKFIQEKCLQTINEIARERIPLYVGEDKNPNLNLLEEYLLRNEIEEIDNGFIIKNSFTLPTEMLAIGKNKIENYPNGFNIALAFEYGVGIVGENTPVEGAWEYNINNYNIAWKFEEYGVSYTSWGYSGAEVYRYSKEEIKKNLKGWVNEYFNIKEV